MAAGIKAVGVSGVFIKIRPMIYRSVFMLLKVYRNAIFISV